MRRARRRSTVLLGLALVAKGSMWLGLVPTHASVLVVLGGVVVSGRATRPALVAASAFIWATMAAGLYESHHFTLLGLLTLQAAWATSGPEESLRPAELVMMAQVTAVYFWAGIWKVNAEFLSGSVVELEWSLSWLLGPSAPAGWMAIAASMATILTEVGCAIALWIRRVPIGAVIAILAVVHAGMILTVGPSWRITLELVAFALACASTYPLFVAAREATARPAGRSLAVASAP